MNAWTTRVISGSVIALSLGSGQAAETAAVKAKDQHQWTLATDDTVVRLSVAGNKEFINNTKQRPILRGADVYRILPPPAKDQWFGLQYYNTFINKGSVLLWQNGGPASQVIKLKGLDRSATYTLTFEDATGKNGSMTGAKLMDDGIEVPMGPNASEIIWIENPNGNP